MPKIIYQLVENDLFPISVSGYIREQKVHSWHKAVHQIRFTSQFYQTESELIQPVKAIAVVYTGFILIHPFRDKLTVHYQVLSASVVFSYCFPRPTLWVTL